MTAETLQHQQKRARLPGRFLHMKSMASFAEGLVPAAWPLCLLCVLLAAGAKPVGAEDMRTEPWLDRDDLLEDRIGRRLAWDRELAPFRFAVKANEAVVTVVGTVATNAESHRARRIAGDVTGVVGIVNGITIDPALESFAGSLLARPDDATLRERIAASLADDPRVTAGDIQIRVEDGHVTLSGQAPDVGQSEHAERIVRSLFGVRSVANDIQHGNGRVIPDGRQRGETIPALRRGVTSALSIGEEVRCRFAGSV
jgi:osmotically-inducible protein OsmY